MADVFNPQGNGNFKFAEYNTGGIVKPSVAVSPVQGTKKSKTDVMSLMIGGQLGAPINTGATPFSQLIQFVAECPFAAVRIGVFNASTNTVPGFKAEVAAGTTLGLTPNIPNLSLDIPSGSQPIGKVRNFVACSWGGDDAALSVTLPASPFAVTGVGGNNPFGVKCPMTLSDWMTCPSQPRAENDGIRTGPVGYVGLVWPAGVDRSFFLFDSNVNALGGRGWDTEGGPTTSPYGRAVKVTNNPTQDAMATPGYFTSGGVVREYFQFPPILIQYLTTDGIGECWVYPGDSIVWGAQADVEGCGYPAAFQRRASTPQYPVSVLNLGISSSTMDDWGYRLKVVAPALANVNIVLPVFTPNSVSNATITPLNYANLRASYAKLKGIAESIRGAYLVQSTGLPCSYLVKNWGASDITYRVGVNNIARASNLPYIDNDYAVSTNYLVNGQYEIAQGLYSPGYIHPNTAGHDMMGAAQYSKWNTL